MCFLKIHHSTSIPESVIKHLGNIDQSLDKIVKENQGEKYIKHNNLISIISTGLALLGILGTIFGAALLYIYLKDIDALNIFPYSVSNSSLFGLSIIYFLVYIVMYILIIFPSITIYYIHINNNKIPNRHKTAWGYSIPNLVSLAFFLLIYFFELSVEYAKLFLFFIIATLVILNLYLVSEPFKNGKNTPNDYKKWIHVFIYSIFMCFFSLLIIISMNKGEDDLFYFFYAIAIFLLTLLSNYIAIQNITIPKGSFTIIFDNIVLLILSIFFVPLLSFLVSEMHNKFSDKKIETAYSHKIMQIFGYADKNDKIYFIEKKFIEQEINANPMNTYENVSAYKNKSTENIYKAYCGRIYWKDNNITVFKRNGDKNYKKINNDKIFILQNPDFYCTDGFVMKKNFVFIANSIERFITNNVVKK